jgi:HD-GYP domain-containing protein (c-di-GMP phosphodiesterase class II)
MAQPSPDALPLAPSQLVPGLYVWLDLGWMDHPFLTNRFLIRKAEDIAIIQGLAAEGRLYYLPARSTAEPLPLDTPPAEPPTPDEATLREQALAQERERLAAARREKIRHIREAAARADRAWESAASATRQALTTLARSPRAAGQHLAQLSRETAASIAQGPDVLLHLLGAKDDHGPQFHALNVMTLCMLVGKRVGLNEQDLSDLAMAALAHDAGKAVIPLSILRNGQRKRHEEDHYRLHVKHSIQLAEESGAFTRRSLEMIAQHHEAADGSGFPKGLRDLGTCASILAMVNRYDRLCTPESPDLAPRMPSEALAHMLRHEASLYDTTLLGTLIKLLGVYPPGTIVRLSDRSLGLVVAPGPHIQRPRVLLYSPGQAEADAPMLDLGREPELAITGALRPTDLAPEVLAWLNPQKRLACYFSVEETPPPVPPAPPQH